MMLSLLRLLMFLLIVRVLFIWCLVLRFFGMRVLY